MARTAWTGPTSRPPRGGISRRTSSSITVSSSPPQKPNRSPLAGNGGTGLVSPGVAWLPASLLLLASVLRPPEIHPEIRVCFGLLAPLCLAATVASVPAAWLRLRRSVGWLALVATVFAGSVWISPRPGVALQGAEAAALAAVVFFAFRTLSGSGEEPPHSSGQGGFRGVSSSGLLVAFTLLSVAGGAAALIALGQTWFGFERLTRALGEMDHPYRDLALVRIASGRVVGPVMLPASLAGLIALTASPAAALAADRGLSRPARLAGLLSALVQLAALGLTGSIAGVGALGLSGAATAVLCLRGRRVRLAFGALLLVGGVIAATGALRSRGFDWLTLADSDHPVGLRLGNWRAAAEMIAQRSAYGSGGGGYAALYPMHLRPGMNETRHAHNSWLEILVEFGLAAAFPLAVFAACALTRWARACRAGPL